MPLKFDQLQIGKAIERGDWHSFYEGIYIPEARPVVVEVLNSLKGAPQIDIERFKSRAKNLALINHPNISRMLTHGEKKGQYYIAMEKESDVRLADHLSNGDYLPPIEATRLVLDMAYGLKAIHDLGFVHGDLRPTNILFNDNGQVKLRNIFQFRQEKEFLLELVSRRPHYVSPEHIRMETLEFPSDQYTLGVMYYQILTGCPPYDASDRSDIWRKHMEGDIPELPMDLKKIAGLSEVIKTLLAKRPKYRYPDDDAMISALEDIEDILMMEVNDLSRGHKESLSPRVPPKDKAKTLRAHGPSGVTPRNWKKGSATMLHVSPSQRKAAASASETKSMLLISGGALLAIGAIVSIWINVGIDPNQDKQKKSPLNMASKVALQTSKEADKEKMRPTVTQKANHGSAISANGLAITPKSNESLSPEDLQNKATRQREEKLAILKSSINKPKNIALSQVEAFLEDADDKIRLIANQVYRDLKGGTMMTEEDLAKVWTKEVEKIAVPQDVQQWLATLKKCAENADPQSDQLIREAVENEDEKVRHLALRLMSARKFADFSEVLLRQLKLRPWDRSLDTYGDQLQDQALAELKTFTLTGDARFAVNLLAFWGKRGASSLNLLGELLKKRMDLSLPLALELAGMGEAGRELLIKTLIENPADSICNSAMVALREVDLPPASLARLEVLYGKLSVENNLYLSALLSSRGRSLEKAKNEPSEFKVLIALEDLSKNPTAVELDSIFAQLNMGNRDLDLKILKVLTTAGPLGTGYLGKVIGGKYPMELKRPVIDSIVEHPSSSSMALLLELACDSQTRGELVKDMKLAITKLGSKVLPILVQNEKVPAKDKIEFLVPMLTESNAAILVEILDHCGEVEARRAIQALLDAYPLAQGCYNTLLREVKNPKSLQFLLKGLSSRGGEGGIDGTISLLNDKDEVLSADAYLSLKQRLIGDREEWHKAISTVNDPKLKAKMISNLTSGNPNMLSIAADYIGFPDENCRKVLIEKLHQIKYSPTLPILNRLILEDNLTIKGDLVKYIFSLDQPHPVALVWGRENLSNTAKKKIAPKLTDLSVDKVQIGSLVMALEEPYQLELRLGIMRYLLSLDKDVSEALLKQLKEGDSSSVKLFREGMILLGSKSTAFLLKKLDAAKSAFLRDEIEFVLKQQKVNYVLNPQTGKYIVQ